MTVRSIHTFLARNAQSVSLQIYDEVMWQVVDESNDAKREAAEQRTHKILGWMQFNKSMRNAQPEQLNQQGQINTLADSGYFVKLFNTKDHHHARCKAFFAGYLDKRRLPGLC